jgi:hypothetical protein
MSDYSKTNRNKVREVFVNKKGETVVRFVDKKFHKPQYADFTKLWRLEHNAPKPNSKRQTLLREGRIKATTKLNKFFNNLLGIRKS